MVKVCLTNIDESCAVWMKTENQTEPFAEGDLGICPRA
jgi:hypothetical protein